MSIPWCFITSSSCSCRSTSHSSACQIRNWVTIDHCKQRPRSALYYGYLPRFARSTLQNSRRAARAACWQRASVFISACKAAAHCSFVRFFCPIAPCGRSRATNRIEATAIQTNEQPLPSELGDTTGFRIRRHGGLHSPSDPLAVTTTTERGKHGGRVLRQASAASILLVHRLCPRGSAGVGRAKELTFAANPWGPPLRPLGDMRLKSHLKKFDSTTGL